MAVEDRDFGYRRTMKELGRSFSVFVGIQGSDATASRGGTTNAQIAQIHEFGAPRAGIPQRSFLRATVDRERKKIEFALRKLVAGVVDGAGLKRGMGIVGEFVRGQIIRTIDRSIGLKPLEATTVAKKGSSRPLIDTGQLKHSITSQVRETLR